MELTTKYLCFHCAALVAPEDEAAHCASHAVCDHEWEPLHAGYTERCTECGETRDYDGSVDDGRDMTAPYEP